MRHYFKKLLYHYRKGGVRGLGAKVAEFLRRRCWSEEHWLIYERSLTDLPPVVSELVRHRRLGFQELVGLHYDKARALPEAVLGRFSRGNEAHGFFLGEQLATLGWSSPGYLELDSGVEICRPGIVGLYDFFTIDTLRSRGFYTNALVQLMNLMRAQGFTAVYIAVDPGNAASIKGIERAGFQPASRIARRWRFGAAAISPEQRP